MNEQIKTTEMNIRNQGHKSQYWTLKLFLDGKLVGVHTSKTYSYLLEIQRGFLQIKNFQNVKFVG